MSVPTTVYQPLGPSDLTPDADPLPPTTESEVFHYSSGTALHGILCGRRIFVSHSATMNDPDEGLYGWRLIRERFASNPPPGYEAFEAHFADMLNPDPATRTWEPPAFVLSGTTLRDNLNQYRLYGMYQLGLAGGEWKADAHAGRPKELPAQRAVWRSVLYGPDEAAPYIDRMLAWAVKIMGSVDPAEFEDTALLTAFAVHVLALHIKHPAYEHESEVRLVFAVPEHEWRDFVHVRPGPVRMLPHLKVAAGSAADGFITEVILGPSVTGQANRAAVRHLFDQQFRHSRYRRFDGFPIEETSLPYRA